jgi:Protein of unknown function (DUF2935).
MIYDYEDHSAMRPGAAGRGQMGSRRPGMDRTGGQSGHRDGTGQADRSQAQYNSQTGKSGAAGMDQMEAKRPDTDRRGGQSGYRDGTGQVDWSSAQYGGMAGMRAGAAGRGQMGNEDGAVSTYEDHTETESDQAVWYSMPSNLYESHKTMRMPKAFAAITLNLFFLRIMKEHSIFLEAAFSHKDQNLIFQSDDFKKGFDSLLGQAISYGNGIVSKRSMDSGQFVTSYTEQSEKVSSMFTGITIDSNLTDRQKTMTPGKLPPSIPPDTESKIMALCREAKNLTRQLADFKKKALMDSVKCRIFTYNFPVELNHMYEEAEHYIKMLDALEKGDDIMEFMGLKDQLAFWNGKMAEHSEATAGKLDPTEKNAIEEFRMFGKEFDMLTSRSRVAQFHLEPVNIVRDKSLSTTKELQDLQAASMKGALACTIQSIILPLRIDHYIRETAHFMYLMEMSKKARF